MSMTRIEHILINRLVRVLVQCTADNAEKSDDTASISIGGSQIRLKRKEVQRRAREIRFILRCLKGSPFSRPLDHDEASDVVMNRYAAFVAFAVGKHLEWWDITHSLDQVSLNNEARRLQMMAGCGKASISGFSVT